MLRRLSFGLLAAGVVAAIFAAGVSFLEGFHAEICTQSAQNAQKDCASYNVVLVAFWHIGEWLNYYGIAITAAATLAVAVFTFYLRQSTHLLWKETHDAIVFSDRSVKQELRAYVAKKATSFHPIGPDGDPRVDVWRVGIIWENTGTTPAIRVFTAVNAGAIDGEIADDFAFPDVGELNRSPTTIGPKQTISSWVTFTSDELFQIERSSLRLYVWAWIEYSDVFEGSPRHRTETAFEVIPTGDARRMGATLDTQYRGPFNAVDPDTCHQPKTQ